MEAFGNDNVVHNLPLILLSGLAQSPSNNDATLSATQSPLHQGGFRVKIDLPPIDSPLATSVLKACQRHDGSEAAWKAQTPTSSQAKFFKIRSVGRVFTLPPRKAPPPPHSPRLVASSGSDNAPTPLILHSPLSPLTPSSPLYPDGIVTPFWIAKHQYQLPCAVLVFFSLTADFNTSSLLDNKIKTEITNIRSTLSSTSYKTRLVVVLLADGPIESSDIEERLSMLRKASNLDPKSLYFSPCNASEAEVYEFVRSLLAALHPTCIEYYRDLSKHARRKRNRGVTPQPTIVPTDSHVLPSQGWNTRYEFKMGVFAEFRQEMDAACRNYEAAYECLFSAEVIESISVWEARFTEARLLADTIAIRILRCFLWNGQTTSAVKAWSSHRDRVQDLLDRREKGTDNYGWEAWQCLWSKTMAQLISRSELSVLNIKMPGSSDVISVFAGPDKSLAVGDRLTAWEQLSHQGYWLDMAQSHTDARRRLALEVPPEERQRPSQPPATTTKNATLCKSYLTPAPFEEAPVDETPGYDYVADIVSTLDAAITHFESHNQLRMKDVLQLKKALENFRTGAWHEVISILRPLWRGQLWRKAGWWKFLQHVGWTLFECAHKVHDPTLLVTLSWELGNSNFDARPEHTYNMKHVLDQHSDGEERLNISLDGQDCTSRVMPSFAFVAREGHVGEPLDCQFVLTSCSQPGSTPLKLSLAKIVFEGALKPVYITSSDEQGEGAAVQTQAMDLVLQESARMSGQTSKRSSVGAIASLTAEGNLTIAPGQTRIFNFCMTPREAGEVSVASITLIIEEETYNLTVTTSEFEHLANQWYETKGGHPACRRVGPERDVHRLQVLPKPPKVEINAQNFKKNYYTNEEIKVELEIANNEEEGAIASLEARLISPMKHAATFRWLDGVVSQPQDDEQMVQILPAKDLGPLASATRKTVSLIILDTLAALDHELEIAINYKLESDEESILRKVLTLDVAVIRPFEANYDFNPRMLDEPWPNFFEISPDSTSSTTPQGLQHLYQVTASLFSFATEPVIIEAILLTATKVTGGAIASTTTGVVRDEQLAAQEAGAEKISTRIEPEQTRNFKFELSVQKVILGDRHTVSLGLALEIGWRRPDSDKVNTAILEVPPLAILMAEPRVLLAVGKKNSVASGMEAYNLTYTIENPSMHFLTFNITMESSEDFAFSGPKSSAVNLVPISRHAVQYKILPTKKGQWLKVQMNVLDTYFNQILRVQPAGNGVKVDKKGNVLVWVD